jgi:hypothetical protein
MYMPRRARRSLAARCARAHASPTSAMTPRARCDAAREARPCARRAPVRARCARCAPPEHLRLRGMRRVRWRGARDQRDVRDVPERLPRRMRRVRGGEREDMRHARGFRDVLARGACGPACKAATQHRASTTPLAASLCSRFRLAVPAVASLTAAAFRCLQRKAWALGSAVPRSAAAVVPNAGASTAKRFHLPNLGKVRVCGAHEPIRCGER